MGTTTRRASANDAAALTFLQETDDSKVRRFPCWIYGHGRARRPHVLIRRECAYRRQAAHDRAVPQGSPAVFATTHRGHQVVLGDGDEHVSTLAERQRRRHGDADVHMQVSVVCAGGGNVDGGLRSPGCLLDRPSNLADVAPQTLESAVDDE